MPEISDLTMDDLQGAVAVSPTPAPAPKSPTDSDLSLDDLQGATPLPPSTPPPVMGNARVPTIAFPTASEVPPASPGIGPMSDLSMSDLDGAVVAPQAQVAPGQPGFDRIAAVQQRVNQDVNASRGIGSQLGSGLQAGLDSAGKAEAGLADMASGLGLIPEVPAPLIQAGAQSARDVFNQRLRENQGDPNSIAFKAGQMTPMLAATIAAGPVAGAAIAGAQGAGGTHEEVRDELLRQGYSQQDADRVANWAGLGGGIVGAGSGYLLGKGGGAGGTVASRIIQAAIRAGVIGTGTSYAQQGVENLATGRPVSTKQALTEGAVTAGVGGAMHGAGEFANWWNARGVNPAQVTGAPQQGPQSAGPATEPPRGPQPGPGPGARPAPGARPNTPIERAADLLGINLSDPNVYLDDIERAARSAYLRTHPDRGGNPADFQAVTDAADLLKTAYKDRIRPASQRPQPQPQQQPTPQQPAEAQPQQATPNPPPVQPAPESQPQPHAEPIHPAVQSVREAAAEVVRNDGLDSPALKPLREAEAALKPTEPSPQPAGEPHAVQEPSSTQVPVREQPEGGAGVRAQNTQGQETPAARPQGEEVGATSDLTRADLQGAKPITDEELESAAPSGSQQHRPPLDEDEPLVSQDERDALTAPLDENAAAPADTLTRPQPTSANEAAGENPTRRPVALVNFGTIDAPDRNALGQHFGDQLDAGRSYPTINEARQEASTLLGGEVKPGTQAAKHVDEAVEIGVTRAARKIISQGEPPHQTFNKLVDLYHRQPNLGVRTSTSISQQAYSTPAPLAYAAQELAGIGPQTTVYEPTAGNGMLLTGADPAKVHANELNPERADALRKQGIPVSTFDATSESPGSGYPAGRLGFDAVIANPPFGAVKDAAGRRKTWNIDGVKTAEVDHAIALRALHAMKDNGRAVLILGAKAPQATTPLEKRRAYLNRSIVGFYKHLYDNYGVTQHYVVNGDLYKRQGAAFPVDVIVIDGRHKASREYPWKKAPDPINSWQELKHVIPSEITRPRTSAPAKVETGVEPTGQQQQPGHSHPATRPGRPTDVGPVSPAPAGTTGGIDRGERRPGPRQPGVGGATGGADVLGPGGQSISNPTQLPAVGSTGGKPGSGVAASPVPRPEPKPLAAEGQPQRGGNGSTEGNRPERVVEPGTGAAERPRVAVPKSDEETEHQVTYRPSSNSAGLGTLTPKNMAHPTGNALDAVKAEHGDINQFVAGELGYPADKLGDYFGAEQIDALALAIHNQKHGAGFILGDQTGVGKGRVVAGIIRYAKRQGLLPIFVTDGPNLFADLVRDLDDIGMNPRANPFEILPTNNLTGQDKIPLPDGRTLATTTNHKAVFTNAVKHYLDGEGLSAAVKGEQKKFDAIFTTYSQLQDVQGNATFRQTAFRQLQRQAYFILDESHDAGGTRKSGWKNKEEPSVAGRAGFVREIIKNAPGVLYSSATYAKRPEVMDLYGRTDMRLAVKDLDDLPAAIAKGGVPLQQAVASMLAEAGQYVRRERSFKGVDFKPQTVDIGLHKADEVSTIFRAIRDFDQIKQGAKDEMESDLVGEGSRYGNDSSTGEAGITSTNFSSILWNLVDQMLLTLKADRMADAAVEAMQRGEKPVIAVDNTMEAALDRYVQEKNIRPGEKVDLDFRQLLRRYLDRSREVVITDEGGNSSQHYLTDAELGPAGVAAYKNAAKLIDDSKLDLPASPIDRLLYRMEAAGLKVGEITGRDWRMRYAPDGSATLAERPKDESGPAGRVRAVNGFNNGTLDALIINRAGSTGLSIHAHPKFADQRRRHMIIGQPAKNIDTFMQMLGRVHRTGQIVPPSYTLLLSNAPAENRPAASLVKKLASLNANVTADRKGAINFDVPDIINDVGDAVVAEYMAENEELSELLGDPLPRKASGDYATEGAAAKVSGRVVLLPIAEQQRFWDDVTSRYAAKIEELDAIGENPLVAKTLDLDAVTKRTMPLFAGNRKSSSPFAGPANLEEVDMKLIGKPFSSEQVAQKLRELHGVERDGQVAQAARAWAEKSITRLTEATAEYREKRLGDIESADTRARVDADIQRNLNAVSGFMDRMPPGTPIALMTPGEENYEGVVLGFEQRGKPKNPAASGSWMIHVAVADAARQIKIPISATIEMRGSNGYDLTTLGERLINVLPRFDHAATKSRETRYIATGNLLAAYDRVKGGRIVHYTARDAGTKTGILLPKTFSLSSFLDKEPVAFNTVENAVRFMDSGFELTTPDQGLRAVLAGAGNRLVLEAAKSKARGGQYTLNQKLLKAAAPAEFVSSGNKMRLTIEGNPEKLRKVVQAVMDQWGLVSHKDKEAARAAMGLKPLDEQVSGAMKPPTKLRPQPPQGRGRQGGFASTGFAAPVGIVLKAGHETGKFVVDNGIRDLVDRVRQYGTPAAKDAADLAEKSINTAKAALGKLSPVLDRALKLTGAGVSPTLHKALASVQKVNRPVGKNYGVCRIVDLVEGRSAPATAAERAVVDAIRKLTDATGQMLHANGVQQQGPEGWQVFNYIPGGKVFLRHYTSEGFGILMRGPAAPGWKELVDGIAEMNNVPRAQVDETLKARRKDMLGDAPQASFKRINAEFTRQWKRVPTHVYVNGDTIPVFQTFPYFYVKGMAENTAARVGFVRHFGQDTAPNSPRAQLRSRFTDEAGTDRPLIQMMRALNNVPVEPPLIEAGTATAQVGRALRTMGQLFKSGLLSLSTIQNLAEPLGNIQAFSGSTDLFKAVWALSRHPQATIATLETLGAITKDVANLAFQPGRGFQSMARAVSETSGRVFMHRYVNELQEKLAAAVAMEKVERMQAGKGNAGDIYDLLSFGWSLPEAQRLARGKGTQAEYNRVVRQAPAKLVGSPMSPAEHTRLSHARLYRVLVAFQGYAEMKMRGFIKEIGAYVKAMKSRDPKVMFSANVKFARYQAGAAVQGAAAYFLLALATGGVLGLKVAWNEAEDHPVRFIRDSWLYTMFAGPWGAIIRNTSQGSSFTQWADAALPFFLLHQIYDAVSGNSGYGSLPATERFAKLIDRIVPVDRAVTTVAAAFGFGRDQQRLEVAKRAYWRWRFEKHPPDETISYADTSAQDKAFRISMRKVYQDVITQRDPNADIDAAFGADKRAQDLAASLRSRLLLSKGALGAKTEDEAQQWRDDLHKRIGDEAYQILEAHDDAIYGWALAIKPPKPKKIPVGR
jgi:hypothetical protein